MLYVVEIGSFGGDLGAAMSNMRTWLDHQHCQPVIFRQVAGDSTAIRLEFRTEAEALAFVGAFGGRLIRPEQPETPLSQLQWAIGLPESRCAKPIP